MREELTGLRKSAIVMLSLGQRRSAELLRRLPEEAAREVRAEMRRVGALRSVSLRTRQLVLGQFCAAASPNPPLPEPPADPAPAPAGPFASLHETATESLLDTIRDEHPQTIALVLAHLAPEKAGAVLGGLDHHKRIDVIKRIAGIEQTSAQVIEQVETSLRQRLAAIRGGTIRSGGVSAVAEILNSSDDHFEDQLLSELEADSPDLAQQIRRVTAIFENLMDAADEDIQAIIEQLDHATISLALRTAGEALKRKVMWNLPQAQAEQIEQEFASMSPVAVCAIEQAQQRVAEVVHRLESAGEIEVMEQRQRRNGRRPRRRDERDWREQHRKAV
ncbi:MAG: flagellar motor switch protein FliG [Humisphaera sp.]|nr:flagellar motor switch protein FliG [Humisphaera sp.]